jgi:type IV secretory pathway VirB10-like protein
MRPAPLHGAGQALTTIRPGFPVRVLVTHDLVLEPYQS